MPRFAGPEVNAQRTSLAAPEQRRVVTSARLGETPERIWQGLLYYEQVEQRPSLWLRNLLPVPVRTTGRKSQVGDEALCEYEGGYLRKRVCEVQPGRYYRFEVIEQRLPGLHGITLQGGSYAMRLLADGATEVTLETRYLSGRRPAALWRPIEASVCHGLHRHILRAMARALSELGVLSVEDVSAGPS